MFHLLSSSNRIFAGQSYWKAVLTSGKTISEIDMKTGFTTDPKSGRLVAFRREIQWYDDIVAAGDAKNIKELHLVTPAGDACLPISEPYSAFQFHRGTFLPFSEQRQVNMQLIGRVDNKETGDCTAIIWDVHEQRLYTDHITTVFDFTAWREGVTKVGRINLDVVGVRL